MTASYAFGDSSDLQHESAKILGAGQMKKRAEVVARFDPHQRLQEMPKEDLEKEKLIYEICCLEQSAKPRKFQEPFLNFIAILVGAAIALTGSLITRPTPDGPPKQAELALEAWQLQTNPIQQSLIDFMRSWPEQLAKYMDCAIDDLPKQDQEKAKLFYDRQFRIDEITRQQMLQNMTNRSPQHVNAEMRIWFGDLDVAEPGEVLSVKMRDYLAFGKGYSLYRDARYKIHEAVIRGDDPSLDPKVRQTVFEYLERRVRVSELAHAAIARWHEDRPRSWTNSAQPVFDQNNLSSLMDPLTSDVDTSPGM